MGGAQEEQGRTLQGVLVILSKHTFYIRFHLSLCQRNYEQVRLVHLIVIAVPAPQIQEQIVDVIKVIPEEWMSKRTVRQIAQSTEKPLNKGEQLVQHYLQFVAPPRFPDSGSVVPRFRGYFRRAHVFFRN